MLAVQVCLHRICLFALQTQCNSRDWMAPAPPKNAVLPPRMFNTFFFFQTSCVEHPQSYSPGCSLHVLLMNFPLAWGWPAAGRGNALVVQLDWFDLADRRKHLNPAGLSSIQRGACGHVCAKTWMSSESLGLLACLFPYRQGLSPFSAPETQLALICQPRGGGRKPYIPPSFPSILFHILRLRFFLSGNVTVTVK